MLLRGFWLRFPLNTDVSFTSLQPLKKEAGHMQEQFKMDKWERCCGSIGCETHSSLGYSNMYFKTANEYSRYFAETAHSCRTDEISCCYFQNYPHNLHPLFESPLPPTPPEELRWEPKEREREKKRNFLECFCSWWKK